MEYIFPPEPILVSVLATYHCLCFSIYPKTNHGRYDSVGKLDACYSPTQYYHHCFYMGLCQYEKKRFWDPQYNMAIIYLDCIQPDY